MSKQIRFHLDESVCKAVAEGLRRRNISVTTSPEEGLIGATDEDQLAFALSQSRVLFTHDDDFLRLDKAGFAHSGILYCHLQRHSLGTIVKRLILFWEYMMPEEMIQTVEYL